MNDSPKRFGQGGARWSIAGAKKPEIADDQVKRVVIHAHEQEIGGLEVAATDDRGQLLCVA